MTRALALVLLVGCAAGGEGDWIVDTWGESYIEEGIPSEVFADGCSVVYDAFEVTFAERTLLDGDGDVVGELPPDEVYDLTMPGPVGMGTVSVPADHYSTVHVRVAPVVHVEGTLTCGSAAARFRWTFDSDTSYTCEPSDLTIPANGSDHTQLTIHGDHLFYDGLENPDAEVRGQPIVDADTNDDGEVTLAELDAVSIPELGYEVGSASDVLTLRAFIAHLSGTLVHIDGEGECRI